MVDVSPHVDSIKLGSSHLMYFMPDGGTITGQTVFYKDKLVEQMNPEPEDFAHKQQYRNIHCYLKILKMIKVNTELNRQIFNVVILKNDL